MTTPKKTTKKTSKKQKPSQRARAQKSLPGMEPVVDKQLNKLAGSLFDARSERMDLTERESELADQLIAAMKVKGLEVYEDAQLGLKVTLKPGSERVSVKRKAEPEEE